MNDDNIPNHAAEWLKDKSNIPELAVICGSGLAQGLGDYVEFIESWQYADIPGMPLPSIAGHSSELLVVKFIPSNRLAVVFSGRVHLYEGISIEELLFQVRLCNALGIKKLILTCASGALNRRTSPGTLGLITNHIDLQMVTGFKPSAKSVKHVDIYDIELSDILENTALDTGIPMARGTLCSVLGPTYETPAEIFLLRICGADWVSMSLAKEACEANSLGIRTTAVCGISNYVGAIRSGGEETTHEKVLFSTKESSKLLWKLLSNTLF